MALGIIERGVPQACGCAHASSAMLCSVHIFKGFSLFRESDTFKTGLDTHLIRIQTRTPLSRHPPYDYSNIVEGGGKEGSTEGQ